MIFLLTLGFMALFLWSVAYQALYRKGTMITSVRARILLPLSLVISVAGSILVIYQLIHLFITVR